jgi:hypothetical protein
MPPTVPEAEKRVKARFVKSAYSGPSARVPHSTLAGLETAMRLVDHVNAALAAHDAIVAVTRTQGLQGISNFHHDTG